ncbi:MAG: two-component system response regulator [Nitrosomonas sp.]|nr:MAG: two-component system response regulator [Nitrosomonas sp.]
MDTQADILIVDDTFENLKVLTEILKKENYKVRPAINGAIALEAIKQSLPDLIILDVKMPGMNGYEVCEILRKNEQCKSIPIIFISALNETNDKVKAFSSGGSDYIIKPFSCEEVKARVSTHLKIKRYQDKMEDMVAQALLKINALNQEIIDTQSELLVTISEICESRSQETGKHVKRVSEYSFLLAKYIGCSDEEAELIRLAAPLHDIGKVAIPDRILLKEGKLGDDEWEIMKTHAEIGYKILSSSSHRPLITTAAQIARDHHEKWDGSGYPRGLRGEEISIGGCIVACADVFDALISERCYKKGWTPEDVVAYLVAQSGRHFNPKLVEIFTKHHDEFQQIHRKYQE